MSDMEAWANELMHERERNAIEALKRCAKAGADPEAIKTLAKECGVDPKQIQVENTNAAQR